MDSNVLIAGATGTAGNAYARALREADYDVRGTVSPRSDARVLTAAGISPIEVDLLQKEDAARAVRDMDALFIAVLGRGDDSVEQERRMTKHLVDAAADEGVRRIIYTSVHDADASTGVPHFDVKADLEAYIRRAGMNYTFLRPATFMAGFRAPWLMERVIKEGVLATPIALHTPISYLAPEDLAQFGLAALTDERLHDATLNLGGPEPVTYAHILPILSRLLGRKVQYQQIPIEVVEAQMGASMAAMIRYFNERGFTVDMASVLRQFSIPLTSVQVYLEATDWADLEESSTT